MGIITAEALPGQQWVTIGKSWGGWASWVPYELNAILYEWAHENDWAVPPWLSKPPEAGEAFQSEELPNEIYSGEVPFTTTYSTPMSDIAAAQKISQKTINDFKGMQTTSSFKTSVTEVTRKVIGEIHVDQWYSYAGFWLLYRTYITPFVKVVNTRNNFRLRKATCKDRDSLPDGTIVIDDDCPKPLPDPFGGSGNGDGSSSATQPNRSKRRIIKEEEMPGCCSCANIADMLAQQTFNIKEMFDKQNLEIGETLSDQTQFLQNQIIAAIPKGFDYEPIFNKIEDARNDIWNGLNK